MKRFADAGYRLQRRTAVVRRSASKGTQQGRPAGDGPGDQAEDGSLSHSAVAKAAQGAVVVVPPRRRQDGGHSGVPPTNVADVLRTRAR